MALQRDRFRVWVTDPDGTMKECEAIVNHQDMLRAEHALLGTPGGSLSEAFTLTTAWCWASLMRQGDYAGPWQTFRDQDCQGMEDMEPVDVDPTGRAIPDASP